MIGAATLAKAERFCNGMRGRNGDAAREKITCLMMLTRC